VTGTGWAGVHVPQGSVADPTLVQVTRLPDSPSPLLTPFDQYPLFYEYTATGTTTFLLDLTVGVCLANSAAPPDLSRLRLAHNVAPYTWGSVEILPLAFINYLDCTDADIAAAPQPVRTWWQQGLARGTDLVRDAIGVLAPRPLQAATWMAGSGLGGTVRTFSPFGAVDTLGYMSPAVIQEQHVLFGEPVPNPPAVTLTTPTGAPMPGVPVNFAVTAGGGTLVGGDAVTDANGLAATTSWTLGFVRWNTVHATSVTPAGTGIAGSPTRFVGIGEQ